MPRCARKDKLMRVMTAPAVLWALFGFGLARPGLAQVPPPPKTPPPDALKVFLDWPGADVGSFRAEIPFAVFVPSLEEADVRVRVLPAASQGPESLELALTGRGRFAGDNNTLRYAPKPGESPEEVRGGVVRLTKIGLLRYVAKTPAAKHVSVKLTDEVKPTSVVDKWDFWVFNLSADQFMDGETQYSDTMVSGKLSANRVTPALKIRMSAYGNIDRQRFDVGGESYKSATHGYGFEGLAVKSLGEHWSVGASVSVASSTYSNIKLSASFAPAVEYDVFRYSESTKRQLRILYKIGFTYATFRELTIYDRLRQGLFRESLSATLELNRPWGTAEIGLEGAHYFFRPFKYQASISGEISFRIWRGLSFTVDGSFAKIHDQIYLPQAGATPEEILLMLRELETDYSYYLSVGLNFRFGSLKSHVVNPRFGSGGRTIDISF
jgi:hypothetical protein